MATAKENFIHGLGIVGTMVAALGIFISFIPGPVDPRTIDGIVVGIGILAIATFWGRR